MFVHPRLSFSQPVIQSLRDIREFGKAADTKWASKQGVGRILSYESNYYYDDYMNLVRFHQLLAGRHLYEYWCPPEYEVPCWSNDYLRSWHAKCIILRY